jgi:DNA-binding LytR/AlgR family response regulator
MLRVLIIEDEALAAEKLEKAIKSINPEIEIPVILNTVDDSIAWLKENEEPDLILSDIHLADGICFNIFSELKLRCPIIFTTAYDKYAIKAFEHNSIDYLLKPIEQERLRLALDKYFSLRQAQNENRLSLFEEFKTMLSSVQKEYKTRFLCKLGNKIKSVPVERIRYFYSKDKMTFLVDGSNNRFPVNNTLDEIDQMLNPELFFRVNRQFVAHFDAIAEIHPYFKGRLKLKLDPHVEDDIVVSAERSSVFRSWLDK